jgi:hypothetical protein
LKCVGLALLRFPFCWATSPSFSLPIVEPKLTLTLVKTCLTCLDAWEKKKCHSTIYTTSPHTIMVLYSIVCTKLSQFIPTHYYGALLYCLHRAKSIVFNTPPSQLVLSKINILLNSIIF